MGAQTVINALASSLEADGFAGRVFLFDYSALNNPNLESLVILSFGGLARLDLDTYGETNWVRTWVVNAEVYSSFRADVVASHDNLVKQVDDVISAIEKRIHLGQGTGSEIRLAKVSAATPVEVVTQEAQTANWLKTQLTIEVEEEETVIAVE